MKQLKLIPFNSQKELEIEVTVKLDGNFLTVTYNVQGDLDDVIYRRPSPTLNRRWELWEESCFELFLKHKDKKEYIEFNFSTANEWNCFYISSYRKNEGEQRDISKVDLNIDFKSKNQLTVSAKIKLKDIPIYTHKDLKAGKILFGISAITKFKIGTTEFWALSHNKEGADFHNHDSFKEIILD